MKIHLLYLILILSPLCLRSQYFEAGLGIGGAVYNGDLTPGSFTANFKLVRPSVGIFATHHFSEKIGIHVGLTNLTITGDDANAEKAQIRARNLSFLSRIWELELTGQYYIIGFEPEFLSKPFGMYIRSGIVAFYHNPKAYYGGTYYALQPLGTEGQGTASYPNRKLYSRIQIGIPIVGGLQYAITSNLNVFIEFGPRLTFTDYLDDVSGHYGDEDEIRALRGDLAVNLSYRGLVGDGEPRNYPTNSQRGNAKTKDSYFNGLVGVSVNMDDLIGNLVGNRVKCPSF